MSGQETMRVIYILGWGRSGSTLLSNVLGESPGAFSVGELHYLWERGIRDSHPCGCGQPLSACDLWGRILRSLPDQATQPDRVIGLQRAGVRVRHTKHLLTATRLPPPAAAYSDVVGEVYSAVGEVAQAHTIIDSSKRPSDGALLTRMPGIAPHFVHLIRDPRAVAHSWRTGSRSGAEMARHGSIYSSAMWTYWNRLGELIRKTVPSESWTTIRYEDLVDAPRQRLEALLDELDLESGTTFTGDRSMKMSVHHTVAGNPSRFDQGELQVQPDMRWLSDQGRLDQVVTTLLCWPGLRRYGYPSRPPKP